MQTSCMYSVAKLFTRISGSCVFLLPLPFELKFWFFEFEYVTVLSVQIKDFIWNFVEDYGCIVDD